MSAQDITRALAALEGRLRSWGVESPAGKARDYVNDLIAWGWQMAPEREQRPHPPTANESCPSHPGGRADDCRGCRADQLAGDESPDPRPRPATNASQHVDHLRNLMRGGGRDD